MRKVGAFKKFFLVLGFLAFLTTGFVSVNVMTSCRAQAQCLCNFCTAPGAGMALAVQTLYTTVILPGVQWATAAIVAWLPPILVGFVATVQPKTEEVAANQESWWDTFWWYNMRPAMQAMTEQLTVRDMAQGFAVGAMGDAMDLNRTNREIMSQEIDSHREQRPGENICVGGTITGSMPASDRFRNAYSSAAPPETLPRTAGALGTAAAQGTAADQKARWATHTSRYCNPADNGGNAGCAAAGTFAGRDLDVTGEIFAKDTIDVRDPDTKQVLDDLLANISEPLVRDPVPAAALASPQGQEMMMKGESYKARRQVIYDAMYYVISQRVPGSGSGAYLEPMRAAAGIDPGQISDNPSHHEMMEVMMSERFRSGRYATDTQIDEPENNQRDLVLLQAFQAMQMSDTLDLLDRYGLLLSAQVGGEVRRAKPFDERFQDRPLR